jgi:hypothetical protein
MHGWGGALFLCIVKWLCVVQRHACKWFEVFMYVCGRKWMEESSGLCEEFWGWYAALGTEGGGLDCGAVFVERLGEGVGAMFGKRGNLKLKQ